MAQKALITGVGGQDGSYLAEHLLMLGYEVHGIVRGLAYENLCKINGVTLHVGDLRDEVSLENIFRKVWPDEVYNLAGQVFVPTSWSLPEETFDVNVCGLTRLLKIIQKLKNDTKVYQASSSEMFGNIGGALTESTPMEPVSPYGVSKLAAHKIVDVYRKQGLYVVAGILFNHESPRRSEHMVTRKITKVVARWACGDAVRLELGDWTAARDWGFAGDYVRAMHLMMQKHLPDDYVIGTGETHTVYDFLRAAITAAGLEWEGVQSRVKANTSQFSRGKNELHYLRADASKAKCILGWEPETSFDQLVAEMVKSDIQRVQESRDRTPAMFYSGVLE